MTVKELIERLQNFNEDTEVLVVADQLSKYPLGSVIGVSLKRATGDEDGWFKEDNTPNATECVIIE